MNKDFEKKLRERQRRLYWDYRYWEQQQRFFK